MSMDTKPEQHVQDQYSPYVDKPDESEDDADYAGGGDSFSSKDGVPSEELYSHPDQAAYAAVMKDVRNAIQAELKREQKFRSDAESTAVRVNTNLAGQVLFQRYTVPVNQPIQICREKFLRGDIVIVNFTDTQTVYVGLHSGIVPGGTDTAAIVGTTAGTARRIRTKRALWAVAGTACSIDVQEEFD